MADIFDKAKRRRIMQAIRSRDTRPEWIVRRCLHALGFRYRLHDRRLPGRPDLVLPRYGTVVLVQGCFWHGHAPCRLARLPKTNTDWWAAKIKANQERDERTVFLLEKLGWTVWILYECELRTATDRARTMGRLLRFLYSRRSVGSAYEYDKVVRYDMVAEEILEWRVTGEENCPESPSQQYKKGADPEAGRPKEQS
jgi:DNA mismatch endonuclease, patch repair protein